MINLYKRLKAWMPLLKLGNTVSRRNELEKYSRYLVLNNVRNAKILDYLKIPRTIDELVSQFGWVYPSKYVDDFLKVLTDDKVIFYKNGKYVVNHSISIEKPDVKFIEDLMKCLKSMPLVYLLD